MGWLDHKLHSQPFGGTFIEAREHQAAAASLTGFPYNFVGTFNKTDQYPLKMTVGPLVLYLEV